MILDSLRKCDIDIRKDLFNNIVLSGGNTMFIGIAERLKIEIFALTPSNININVFAPQNRKYSVFLWC